MPTTGVDQQRAVALARRACVSSSCARCMGLRVWNATTRCQPQRSNFARSSLGSSRSWAKSYSTGRVMPADRAAEVDRVGMVEQIIDAGVRLVGGPEHRFRLVPAVRLPDRLDGHGGDQEAFRIPQADPLPGLQAVGKLPRHVEDDRDRP